MPEAVGRGQQALLGRRASCPRGPPAGGPRGRRRPDRRPIRPLLIAGAIAYWCEGTKNKPHRRSDRVVFTNSDPSLVRFFLRFLDATGTPPTDLSFRICIHENADAESAQRFWLEITGARRDQFRAPTLKRHNPKTVRKNTGVDYHGCLRIDVSRSSGLYRKIEGWAEAIMSAR